MNITISKDALEQAISAPAKLARAAKVDYLSCILLDARGDGLDAAATDMNESVRCFAMALVEEEGCALVPALALSGVVKTLPDKAVTLRDGGRGIIVECGKTAICRKRSRCRRFRASGTPTRAGACTRDGTRSTSAGRCPR